MHKTTPFGVFPVIVCGFAIYYLVDTRGARFETIGYGILCTAIVFFLTFLLFLRAVRTPGNLFNSFLNWLTNRPRVIYENYVALTVACSLILYAGLMPYLGFTLATTLVYFWLLWLMGWRNSKNLILFTFGLTLLSHVTLVELLNIPLPEESIGIQSLFNWKSFEGS